MSEQVREQQASAQRQRACISRDKHQSTSALIDSAVETVFAGTIICHHSNDDLKQGFFPEEVVYVLRPPWIRARLLDPSAHYPCVYVSVCIMSQIFIFIFCLAVV